MMHLLIRCWDDLMDHSENLEKDSSQFIRDQFSLFQSALPGYVYCTGGHPGKTHTLLVFMNHLGDPRHLYYKDFLFPRMNFNIFCDS
jgi:hypothetical protein